MQGATAVEEVRARLQELAPDFWTSAEVLRALNEGLTRFSNEERWPWLYTLVDDASLTAGQDELQLVEGVTYDRFFNLMMHLDGDERPRIPQRVGPAEGYQLRARYWNESQEPMAYYIVSQAQKDPSPTAGAYIATVKFIPTLTRDADIEYQYIRDPGVIAGSTEHVDVPTEYVQAVIAWATGQLFMKELQWSSKAEEQFGLYRKIVDDAKRQLKKIGIGEGVAWGRNMPEFGYTDDASFTELVTPQHLGS